MANLNTFLMVPFIQPNINCVSIPSPNTILELIFSDITFAILAATRNLSATLTRTIDELIQQFSDLANFFHNLLFDFQPEEEDWVKFLDRHKSAMDLLRFDFSNE